MVVAGFFAALDDVGIVDKNNFGRCPGDDDRTFARNAGEGEHLPENAARCEGLKEGSAAVHLQPFNGKRAAFEDAHIPRAMPVCAHGLACGAALCARAEADHHALNFFGCNSLKEFRIRKLHNISSKLLQMQ